MGKGLLLRFGLRLYLGLGFSLRAMVKDYG